MKNKSTGMTLIVKTITRMTVGVILVYGVYIVLQGHSSPGGGFAGGLIIALSFIHLMLAFGKEAALKKLNQARGLILMGIGALLYLIMAVFGFMGKKALLSHKGDFKLFGAGEIPFYDIAIALMVASGLFLVFLVLVLLKGEAVEK